MKTSRKLDQLDPFRRIHNIPKDVMISGGGARSDLFSLFKSLRLILHDGSSLKELSMDPGTLKVPPDKYSFLNLNTEHAYPGNVMPLRWLHKRERA